MKSKEASTKNNNCHAAHRQRMRDKVTANGFSSLAGHEKLEFLLYYTIPRANTNEQGHRLLERFGSFSAVLDAPVGEIEKVEGVGKSSAYFLSLLPKIFGSYAADKKMLGEEFSSLDEIGKYLTSKFYGYNVERTYMLCLDSKNKCIAEYELESGSVSNVYLNPQIIVAKAIEVGCTRIVLAHNHPNGVCLPSGDDYDSTRRLSALLRDLHLNLVEHFIIVNDSYCTTINR